MSLPKPVKANGAGAYKLSANGYSVTLPNSITSQDEPIEGQSYFESVDGRDGYFAVRSPNFLGRELQLTGTILDEPTVRDLKHVLNFKRVTVERDNLILVMDVEQVVITETVIGSVWTVDIEMVAPVFFWSSKELITQTESPGVVSYDGTVSTGPIFTVLSPVGGIEEAKFEISGKVATFTAPQGLPIPQGKHLVIDCDNLTAVTEDGSVTGLMNDGFFLNPPVFNPGLNLINATINGNELFPVQIIWVDGEPILFNGQTLFWYPFASAFELSYIARYL